MEVFDSCWKGYPGKRRGAIDLPPSLLCIIGRDAGVVTSARMRQAWRGTIPVGWRRRRTIGIKISSFMVGLGEDFNIDGVKFSILRQPVLCS